MLPADFRFLRLEQAGRVAVLTLARPPVNALNRGLREELLRAFDMLGDRDDIGAVVLTGAGHVFCAGADIKERNALTGAAGETGHLHRLAREAFHAVMDCAKPVVAAVNGPALGAGFITALGCDILLAAEGAFFAMPEIDVGLPGGVRFLQRHFTPSKLRRLLLTGQRVTAHELHRLGVVEECLPAEALLPAATALAAEIAAKSPGAVRLLKDSLAFAETMPLREGYRLEQGMTAGLSRSDEARAARQAFLDKGPETPPRRGGS